MKVELREKDFQGNSTLPNVEEVTLHWKDAKGRPRKLQFNQDDDNKDIINMESSEQICLSALEGDWFLIRVMGP